MTHRFLGPVLELDAAVAWREEQRAHVRRVVFTNGVFDVLHAGHVAYLAWARAQGDALIVGLNTDESVRATDGTCMRSPAAPKRAMPFSPRVTTT